MRLQLFRLLLRIIRLFTFTLLSFARKCLDATLQMWFKTNLQNIYSTLNRSRRIVLFILVICALLLYMWPSWLTWGSSRMKIDTLHLCIDSHLSKFHQPLTDFDAVVRYIPAREQKNFYPYVGNGYIGTGVESRSPLYLKYGRSLTVPIKFYPITQPNFLGFRSQEADLLDLKSGMVHRVQCFEEDEIPVIATTQIYAHRTRPSVLVQELRIQNPTDHRVTLDLDQIGFSDWKDVKSKVKRVNTVKAVDSDYTLSVATTPYPTSPQKNVMVIAIATLKLPDTVTIESGGTWKYRMLTAVKYTDFPVGGNDVGTYKTTMSQAAEEELTTVLNIDANVLREDHQNVWAEIWSSGFSISISKAANAVNGDKINSTIYYLTSQLPAPLHDMSRNPSDRRELEQSLYFPDRCYGGHHTLQNSKMWMDTSTMNNLNELVKTWLITLEKQGCATMLKAGAEGVLQAMMLSFGALKFSNDHLEFDTHPRDLHRDYMFRRINYGNHTHVNISVIVGEDNKAILYVALDRNDRPYYACDAGCLDAPVKLNNRWTQFPVKLTDPLTAILYITADKQHMEELKHAIHVRENAEAPAHEHHVIALHKHGHHLGGLPVLFWVSIGLLIAIFHLFLFKLVYNEYCSTDKYGRSRYNL